MKLDSVLGTDLSASDNIAPTVSEGPTRPPPLTMLSASPSEDYEGKKRSCCQVPKCSGALATGGRVGLLRLPRRRCMYRWARQAGIGKALLVAIVFLISLLVRETALIFSVFTFSPQQGPHSRNNCEFSDWQSYVLYDLWRIYM